MPPKKNIQLQTQEIDKNKSIKSKRKQKDFSENESDDDIQYQVTIAVNIINTKPKISKTLKVINKEGEFLSASHTKIKLQLGDGKFKNHILSIASWNINGIRAILKKNDLTDYFKSQTHDIICLNEIKIDEETFLKEHIDKRFPQEYFIYLNCCKPPKAGYSGVAIFSKVKPIKVFFDLNLPKHDQEGRTLTLEFEKFYLVSCYVPNAGQKLDRLKYRTEEWDIDFKNYLGGLKSKKPTIVCGDLNVAHHEIDIANPKGKEKYAGYTPEEREGFTNLLNDGWIDTFRKLNREVQKFTFFSARLKAREKNIGWRLDYFLIDSQHGEAITSSEINNNINGSDHTPIEIKLDMQKF